MFTSLASGTVPTKMVVDVTQPKGRKGRRATVSRKRLMTQAELQEWLSTAVESDETSGRCKVESRFTFKQLKVVGAVRETAVESARVQGLVHRAVCSSELVPAELMSAATSLTSRLPKTAQPVEFAGSMGFKAALLTELGSVPMGERTEAAAAAVEAAFPFGDIDLAVHVPSEDERVVAQMTIDNVVCDVKSTLDRTLWDTTTCPHPLRDMDLGAEYISPFDDASACSTNCSMILPVDSECVVRVDVPMFPNVDRRMRFSPLFVTRNTSIRAGFTLTRLLLCVRHVDGGRIMVPLLDISLSVGPKRKCCPTSLFGVKIMAASAKAVHRHLDDLVDAGDPSKREKRELQQAAARQARQAFMQASRGR
jgi:hypothetical protein